MKHLIEDSDTIYGKRFVFLTYFIILNIIILFYFFNEL